MPRQPGRPRDSTPRGKAANRSARALESLSALGQMTGGIVHDVRNILSVIASGLRVAAQNAEDPVKHQAALAAAEEGVERGIRMVSRLLAFPTPPETIVGAQDLNGLLRQLEAFLKYGAGPGNRVILELADELPRCAVDPLLFNAAILNLVINARDALHQGGTIRIGTHAAERDMPPGVQREFVQVQVRDDGVGMPRNVVARIFDPYFTTKGDSGTGLGVPQVKSLMSRIGGAVEVASKPGVGTTFDLFFPISEEPVVVPVGCSPINAWANPAGEIIDPLSPPMRIGPRPPME